jgi:hypothetical protein
MRDQLLLYKGGEAVALRKVMLQRWRAHPDLAWGYLTLMLCRMVMRMP